MSDIPGWKSPELDPATQALRDRIADQATRAREDNVFLNPAARRSIRDLDAAGIRVSPLTRMAAGYAQQDDTTDSKDNR